MTKQKKGCCERKETREEVHDKEGQWDGELKKGGDGRGRAVKTGVCELRMKSGGMDKKIYIPVD